MPELVKNNIKSENLYTVNTMVGKLLFECFFSSDTFKEVESKKNTTFTEEHSHAFYELLICKKGSGYQFINNCAHMYETNTCMLIPSFVPHGHISKVEYPEIRASIAFEISKKQPFDVGGRDIIVSSLRQLNEQGYYLFTADNDLIQLIDLFTNAVTGKRKYSELVICGLLSAILSRVFQTFSDYASNRSSSFPTQWDKTFDPDQKLFLIDYYLNQLCNNNIKMEDLCEKIHISQNQLNRIVKETYGMTYKQKYIDLRLAYIKYFLKYSDLTINEIAEKSDFMESSNLSLFFKQHCGETPSQYRSRVRDQ